MALFMTHLITALFLAKGGVCHAGVALSCCKRDFFWLSRQKSRGFCGSVAYPALYVALHLCRVRRCGVELC